MNREKTESLTVEIFRSTLKMLIFEFYKMIKLKVNFYTSL